MKNIIEGMSQKQTIWECNDKTSDCLHSYFIKEFSIRMGEDIDRMYEELEYKIYEGLR